MFRSGPEKAMLWMMIAVLVLLIIMLIIYIVAFIVYLATNDPNDPTPRTLDKMFGPKPPGDVTILLARDGAKAISGNSAILEALDALEDVEDPEGKKNL